MVESRRVTGVGAGLVRVVAPARSARRSRSAVLALLLAGAAMTATGARAATALDLSGLSVPLANFDTAGFNYDFVQNGTALISPTSNYSFGGVPRDGTGVQVFGLQKLGAATLTLTGQNTYSGDTVITTGTLQAGAVGTLSANSKIVLAGTLDLAGGDQSVAGLSGNGNIVNTGVGAVLTINLGSGIESYSGPISGAGATIKIVKVGAGQQDLHGHSSYTGGTDITGGVLGFGFSDSLGIGKITFAGGGGTLRANGVGTVLTNAIELTVDGSIDSSGHSPVLAGVITGPGILTKVNGGVLEIDNVANNYGGTVLTQGTLLLGNDNVLGHGTLTITGNSKVNAVSSQRLDSAIVLQNATLTVDAPGTTLQLDGIVSGSGGVTVNSGAQLILANANTYSGLTRLSNSTLGITDGLAIGGGTSTLLVLDSTLGIYASNLTVANTIRVNGAFTVDTGGNTVTLSGHVNDVNAGTHGALKVVGGGTVILTAASNGYTLGTTVSNAALQVSSDAQLGNGNAGIALNSGKLRIDGTSFTSTSRVLTLTGLLNEVNVIDAGATVSLGLVTGGGDLHKEGLGAISLTGTNSLGNVFAGHGVINFDTNGALGVNTIVLQGGNIVTATSGLVLDNSIALAGGGGEIHAGSGDLTLNGLIYSVGKLVKTGSGTFDINHANNTYSGGTSIGPDSTVRIGASGALGASTGVVEMEDFARLTTSVDATLGNAILINGHTHIDGGGTHTLNLTGAISGAGDLHLYTQAGTVVLSGVNTFSGGTDVEFGTLRVDSSTGTGGTLVDFGARLQGVGSLAATTTISSGGTLAPGNSAGTIGFTNLTLDNGAFVDFELGSNAPGASDYIVVSGDLKLDGAIFNFTDIGGLAAGTYHLIGYSGTLTGSGPAFGAKPVGFANFEFANSGNSIDLTVTALIGGTQYWDGGNVVADNNVNGGSGNWNTAGQNWTNNVGSVNVAWGGGTAVFDGANSGTVTVVGTQNFDTLEFDRDGYTLTGGTLHAVSTAGMNVVFEGDTAVVNSVITGSSGLLKTGLGTLSLGGANTFSGGVHIAEGGLVVTFSGALGTGALELDAGSSLDAVSGFGNDIVINGVAGAGATFDMPTGATLTGDISGTGSLTKTGAGALELSGNNINFSGGINLTDGRLQLSSDNAAGTGPITTTGSTIGYTNGITNAAAIIVNSNSTQLQVIAGEKATQSGVISELNGPRTVFKIAGGNLVLTGANTTTGGFVIDQGTLTVAGGNNLGTGALGAADGVTLAVGITGNQSITIANDIHLAGALTIGLGGTTANAFNADGTINGDGNTVTLTGRISGSGSLFTDGTVSGNLVIAGASPLGANNYAGGTTLNYTVASVGADGALGTGVVTVGIGGGVVNNSGHAVSLVNDVNFVSGGNSLGGNSDLTLTGALTGSTPGAIKYGAGTLTLTNTASDVDGGIEVFGGALRVDGALTNANLIVDVASGATLQGIGSIAGHVLVESGGILAPGDSPGTITFGSLSMAAASSANYQFGEANVIGGAFNDRTVVTGLLDIGAGTLLNVTNSGALSIGVYNVFTFGTLGNNGLVLNSLPGGFTGILQTLVPHQINLLITAPGSLVQYWDGADMVGQVPGVAGGGSGTWNSLNTNWTSNPFELNSNWQNNVGIFGGAAGTVNMTANENFSLLQFSTDGYHVTATGAGGLTVTAGDVIVTDTGVTATIAAKISGNGSITKQGTGNLVLNGANSYTGNTNLTAGTITVGTNTALGGGVLTMSDQTILAVDAPGLILANNIVTLAAARINSGPTSLRLNGVISGAGSISQIGTGNLILNGHNTFTGNLGINAGTVTLNNSDAASTGLITIDNLAILAAGDNLVLGNHVDLTPGAARIDTKAFSVTLNGTVTGPGSLSMVGTGNLILNGHNSFWGNLGINSGTVTLGNSDAASTGLITIDNLAILAAGDNLVLGNHVDLTPGAARIDTKAFSVTLNGQVTGPGSLSMVGTGNLILNGHNTFSGNLGINSGTVTLGNSDAASTGLITIDNLAILAAGDNIVLGNHVDLTQGAARIDTKAFAVTLNGPITGPGSLSMVGTGNLILNGHNTFTGNLGINSGTVTLGNSDAASTGLITIDNLAILAAGDNIVLSNHVDLTQGAARIDTKAFSVTLNGTVTGPGSLSMVGTGNLILNGHNSFWGNLGINSGTVTLGNSDAASTGLITIDNLAILAAGDNLVLGNHVDLTPGAARIDTKAFSVTLNGQVTGPGSLSMVGTGNLILNGHNTFTGNLGINAGTVTLGNSDAASTGLITIDNLAILAAGDNIVLGNHVDLTQGAARIDTKAFAVTLNGKVTGTGSLSMVGTGNLILNGHNTFSGNLGINAGTVTLGNSDAASTGLITIDNLAILAAGDNLVLGNHVDLTQGAARIDTKAFAVTLNGPVTGTGSLSMVSTGNLILNGHNSFSGNLGINAGTVTLGANDSAGSGYITIDNNATLAAGVTGLVVANKIDTTGAGFIDSGSGLFTLTGTIGINGGITKIGTGTLLLTNTNDYAGGTTVAAGRLNVTGALTKSAVTVASGATLGGTGSVASLVVKAGGNVAPGLSPGTLTVVGNATFAAGSTYTAEVSGVLSDKLAVGGIATLNGANLALVAGTNPVIFGTTYQILTAAGGRTGTFTPTTTGFIQAFKPTLVYSATDVKLTLAPASIVGLLGSGAGGSSNITNIAAAFDASVAAGFNPQNFFNMFLQSGAALGTALNQLTGEVTSANSRTAMADSRYIREAALDRLGASLGGTGGATNGVNTTGADEHKLSVWARGIGSWTKSDSDGNGSRLSIDAKGVITGVDASFGDWKAGALFNYLESSVDTRGLGSGKVKSTGGGVYAGYRADKGIAFGIGGAASHVKSTEHRAVSFSGTSMGLPNTAVALTGRTGGTSYQVFGDLSYDLAAAANTRIEPFFRAAYVKYNVDGFNEAGGFAGLDVAKGKYDTTYLTGGVRGSILLGSSAWLRGSAAYQRTSGDRSPVSLVTIQGTGNAAAIRGTALDKSAFAGELGVDVNVGKNVTLGAGYSGVIGKNTQDNGVKATLTVGF